MTETMRVRAKLGEMLPDLQRPKAFVGWVEAQPGESADHVVPGGRRYRIVRDGVVVANNGYHRRAIQRGSLERLADGVTAIDGAPVVLPADGSLLTGEPVPSVEGAPGLDPNLPADAPNVTAALRRQKREV